jgi:hypothetical protein
LVVCTITDDARTIQITSRWLIITNPQIDEVPGKLRAKFSDLQRLAESFAVPRSRSVNDPELLHR